MKTEMPPILVVDEDEIFVNLLEFTHIRALFLL